MKGQLLPVYLHKLYGLDKNEETASEALNTMVIPPEKAKIEAYAANQSPKTTVSDIIRQFMWRINQS